MPMDTDCFITVVTLVPMYVCNGEKGGWKKKREVKRDTLFATHCVLGVGGDKRGEQGSSEGRVGRLGAGCCEDWAGAVPCRGQ